MTKKEAIEVLKELKSLCGECLGDEIDDPEDILTNFSCEAEDNIKAIKIAIKALENESE